MTQREDDSFRWPPDAFPVMTNGEPVPFAPTDLPRPDLASLKHALDTHRAGTGIADKTEFPVSWPDEDIVAAIAEVIRASNAPRRAGDQIVFESRVLGFLIRVTVRTDALKPYYWTAYPPEQPGISKNPHV